MKIESFYRKIVKLLTFYIVKSSLSDILTRNLKTICVEQYLLTVGKRYAVMIAHKGSCYRRMNAFILEADWWSRGKQSIREPFKDCMAL